MNALVWLLAVPTASASSEMITVESSSVDLTLSLASDLESTVSAESGQAVSVSTSAEGSVTEPQDASGQFKRGLNSSTSEHVIVDEEAANRCGQCVRGCLGFFAGLRELRSPDGGLGSSIAAVTVVVDAAGLVSERTLQQFTYRDIRGAVQTAERNLQRIHREASGDLLQRMRSMRLRQMTMTDVATALDEDVWTLLRGLVIKHDLLMRQHEEHYAQRTDEVVELNVLKEVVDDIKTFVEETHNQGKTIQEWEAKYREWKRKLNRTARVIKITMENDSSGRCLYWMCWSCGVRGV